MPNQFFSPEGDLENYFVTEYWLIDQYVGDELWVWGANGSLQLGINATGTRSTPVTVTGGGTNWKQIDSGVGTVAAVKTDGTLWTWGSGSGGILGNNATTTRSTPIQTSSGGTNWKQVSVGDEFAAAIKTDGTLWVWGANGSGALGTNNTISRSTPVTTFAGGDNWKQVACGERHMMAVKTDGTLWGCGRNSDGGQVGNARITNLLTPVTTFSGGNNWKQVACGDRFTSAIKTDGTLWTFGENGGQLGINNTISKSTPVTTFAGGNNWKQVAAGVGEHVLAIKTDGTLWTWGANGSLQLGNNATGNRLTPVTTFIGGTTWKQVAGGESHSAAIKTDGTLWVWGSNASLQLGINATGTRSTPVTTFAGGTNWKQVSAGSATLSVQSGINAEYPLS
jgi:alpha-tubulin suppressor-like RCC1 family protein